MNGVHAVLRGATSGRVVRTRPGRAFWRGVVAAPGLPDPVRAGLANRLQHSLIRAGYPGDAAALARTATRRISADLPRRDVRAGLVAAELDAGRVPPDLHAVWAAHIEAADVLLARGDRVGAARTLSRALPLGFHRVPHFDRLSSPLAEDPAAFLAPVRHSHALRLLNGHARARPAAPRPAGRPLRLLIATRANANFLDEIRRRYGAHPEVETRFLDLAADPVREPLTRRTDAMIAHLLGADPGYGRAVAAWLGPHLRWADTVLVDWCVSTAVLVTLLDPGDTRVIVRLHSFELFSRWPHLVNLARLDDLVVVAPHMADLARAVLPRLAGEDGPRVSVIPNAMTLDRYRRDKPDAARFTVGLVGVNSVAKDPRWAVRVLGLLRERDPRYRLVLIGAGLDPAASPAVREYDRLLAADLAPWEATGAAVRVGHTTDVPAALREVGVILSSSVRESFHCALVEGAASGAVPVVRDWPFFAGRPHGARTLFPADWVVDTPAEAAARILATTATDAAWRREGRAAAEHAARTWDWSVTAERYDRLLLG